MKKFDIELAKQGKPVCTRGGKQARIICFDRNSPLYKIVALILIEDEETVGYYTKDGKYPSCRDESNLDLMMVGEKRKMWVNVYSEYSGSHARSFGDLKPYATEEEAKKNIGDPKNYITTVPVEWEE